ncbi:methyl-accepting chemotaxis factor, putative [Babesia ovis]|uniref:Methyl-accepting chemotaxis factor, putative n=1 Tax=Babesia ovis TaxID=5869 RepID=A0A9W5WTN4_BABOV|nr:methyl-accepting chemotaxis factor, putative [Babesia ovis]
MCMAPFTYVKRATDARTLQRLLNSERHALPETIKFVAVRALGTKHGNVLTQSDVKTVHSQIQYTDKRLGYNRDRLELATVIQERVAHTSVDDWAPSAIITVSYYLAKAGIPLWSHTEDIFRRKVAQNDGLNVLDIWQALWLSNVCKIDIDIDLLKHYIDTNAKLLFRSARCKNVSSVLNALSAFNKALDGKTLEFLARHCMLKQRDITSLKDISNFCNALATQLSIYNKAKVDCADTEGHRPRDPGDNISNSLREIAYAAIEDSISRIEAGCQDIEGMTDVLDAMVKVNESTPSGGGHSRRIEQMQQLVNQIDKCLQKSIALEQADRQDLEALKKFAKRNAEPRILKVVLRCLVQAGLWHMPLVSNIIDLYRKKPERWSARGNAEVLRAAAYYSVHWKPASDIAKHITERHIYNIYRHIDPGETLVDACVLAAQNNTEECYRLVARVLEEQIHHRDLWLALLLIQLCPGIYDVIPLRTVAKVARRLECVKGCMPVHAHTPKDILDTEIHDAYSAQYKRFSDICQVKLE